MSKTWARRAGLGLIAAGIAARAAVLLRASLWSDEAATLIVARFPASELLSKLPSIESLPPLHFFLVHAALALFSNQLLALRLVSLACGAAALPLFWALAKRLSPSRALWALALACAASSWIHASQDGRPYALVLLLALADLVLAWDLSREWSRPKAVLFGAAGALGLSSHYLFGLLLLGNACFFGWTFRRRTRELWPRLACFVGPAAACAALLPLARAQAAHFSALTLLRAPLDVRQLLEMLGQWLFDPSFLGLALGRVMLGAGVGAALLLGAAALRPAGRSPALTFFLIHAAAAFAGLRGLEWLLGAAMTQARYLLFLSPLLFCALVEAAAALSRAPRLAAAAALPTLVLSGAAAYYFAVCALDPRLGDLARRVRALPGRPPIVHLSDYDYLPLRFYYLPEYRHWLVASAAGHLQAAGLPGGSGIVDEAQLSRLGRCLVVDPDAELFPRRWGSADGRQLAAALRRVAGR